MRIRIFKCSNKGFSLIEMIIAIALFTLVFGAAVAMSLNIYRIYYFDIEQSHAIDEARAGVAVMVKEIRRARIAEDGSYVIADAQDFQFTFYADVDQDDDIEKVRYFIENEQFKKEVVNPVGVPATYPAGQEKVTIISYYVVNTPPTMRYFDGDGNELAAPVRRRDTKLMRLTLEVDVNPGEAPASFILISEIQIRNIKTNL